jgi:hypothetical protein
MALHAAWVSGNAARAEWVGDNLANVASDYWNGSNGPIPWSNVNGLPHGWGTTFRGKNALTSGPFGARTTGPFDPANPFQFSQKGYWFHFPLPTPVIVADRRSRLLRVFCLWEARPGAAPCCVHVWDGPNRKAAFAITPNSTGSPNLVEGVTQFNLPTPPEVQFGVNISLGAFFSADADLTFFSAGADFDV